VALPASEYALCMFAILEFTPWCNF